MFQHDSFFGFLNLFYARSPKNFSARTPYPAIKNDPTITDVIANFNISDFGLFTCYTFLHGFLMFGCFRGTQRKLTVKEILKLQNYFTNAYKQQMIMATLFSFSFMTANSTLRLRGFIDNGLMWKFRDTTPIV